MFNFFKKICVLGFVFVFVLPLKVHAFMPDNLIDVCSFKSSSNNWRSAIQDAIDFAHSNRKSIFISKGCGPYFVDGVPIILKSGVNIYSDGAEIVLESGDYNDKGQIGLFTTKKDLLWYWDEGFELTENIVIDGLLINGNITNVITESGYDGIYLYKVKNVKIENCKIFGLPGNVGAGHGISVLFSDNVVIDNVDIERTDRQNVMLWESRNVVLENSSMKNSFWRGCLLISSNSPPDYQSSNAIIQNCVLVNNDKHHSQGKYVIRFSGQSGGIIRSSKITAGEGFVGIYITDIYEKNIRILDNDIIGGDYGIKCESASDKKLHIEGNVIRGARTGCYFNSSRGSLIFSKNILEKILMQSIYVNFLDNIFIENNVFDGGKVRPAFFVNGMGSISNNQIFNLLDKSSSLFVGGEGEKAIVAHNIFKGNVNDSLMVTKNILIVDNIVGNVVRGK